jgi:acyl-CoA reductase-like NAD-dependent aldehyde dehydrogenase
VSGCHRVENGPESNALRVAHPSPLEARERLVLLLRAHAPRAEQEAAADAYIAAIKRQAKATGRRLPVPSRAGILRLLS